MAGVKGRSGGARPGAGRPRNPPVLVRSRALQTTEDPDEWLREAMQDESVPMAFRVQIAEARRRMDVLDLTAQSALAGNVTSMRTFLAGSAHTRAQRKP